MLDERYDVRSVPAAARRMPLADRPRGRRNRFVIHTAYKLQSGALGSSRRQVSSAVLNVEFCPYRWGKKSGLIKAKGIDASSDAKSDCRRRQHQ